MRFYRTSHRLALSALLCVSILMPSIASACYFPVYLTLIKSAPETIRPGEVITYTLTYYTQHNEVGGIFLHDHLPGMTYVSGCRRFFIQSVNNGAHPLSSYTYGQPNGDTVLCFVIAGEPHQTLTMAYTVPLDATCGSIINNHITADDIAAGDILTNPNRASNTVSTRVVCDSSSSSSSSAPSSSSSSSTPSSSSSSSTPVSSSSAPSSSSSPAIPVVTVPGNSISNSTAIATNLSNNQNTQNVSIFNAGANISVGAPNINVNTGGANVAVNATASPSTAVVNNTQGAAQYQPPQYPPYPQYPSYPPPPPVYPVPQPPQQIIIEKPVVITPPPIVVQPLPQTGIGDFTGSVENTRKFLSPISGNPDGGLIATAFLSLVLLFGATGLAGVVTKKNVF